MVILMREHGVTAQTMIKKEYAQKQAGVTRVHKAH